MTNYTKGPWKVGNRIAYGWDIMRVEDEQAWICAVNNGEILNDCDNDLEALANACLISAAPDMYEVLKELEESISYWSEYDVPIGIVDRIRSAIAKAEGVV